jgi:adenosylcobinamide-GDP ribazoletransferase
MMKAFCAALGFLTIVPVPTGWAGDEKDLCRSVWFFPAVGILIGAAAGAWAVAATAIFPPLLAAVTVVLFLVLASGGLHLDGLADATDGLMSARPRERALEIMRDSRIGTMGVLGVTGCLLLKVSALAGVAPRLWPAMVFLVPLAGRFAILAMMSLLEYARGEHGLGTAFIKDTAAIRWSALIGLVLFLAASVILLGTSGVVGVFLTLACALAFCRYVKRRIGGYTGDTLGAICELSEIVPVVVAAAMTKGGA